MRSRDNALLSLIIFPKTDEYNRECLHSSRHDIINSHFN